MKEVVEPNIAFRDVVFSPSPKFSSPDFRFGSAFVFPTIPLVEAKRKKNLFHIERKKTTQPHTIRTHKTYQSVERRARKERNTQPWRKRKKKVHYN
jgi:hypothetical protein